MSSLKFSSGALICLDFTKTSGLSVVLLLQNSDNRKPLESHEKLAQQACMSLTVITPVAAVTPASPNKAVAASVTSAVAAMLTTLFE